MQSGRKLLVLITIFPIILASTLLHEVAHAHDLYEGSATGETGKANTMVSQQVQSIIPTSERLVDGAIAVLSKGWRGMSPAEREAFLALYDPAGTGEIDEGYVEAVLVNYRKIREELNQEIAVVFEPDNSKCEDMRLYYTDLVKLHVCPYYLTEKDEIRKARTLIHEMAHMALLVTDRPYYRPTNEAYAQLTPNGSWMAQLPVVGPVIREIQGNDTLYHPDAYAHFTVAVSGQPVPMGMYVSHHQIPESAVEMVNQPLATGPQVVDSWALGS
jgi:predicted SprT family Zn-dependent metalloprotease